MTRLASTTYRLGGDPRTERQLRSIWHQVAALPDIGAIAFEIHDDEVVMIIKHKETVGLDRDAVGAAVRAAGPYDLLPPAGPTSEETP